MDGQGSSKWAVLGLVALGSFMTTLDGSIVNIGLPAIAQSFNKPISGEIEWVIIAYLVVIASVLLTFGRLSDVLGRRPIWAAGLALFTTGSVLCGASPSLEGLIAARAFQGIGSALIYAPGLALLTDAFPSRERGRAIGLNAVAVSLGVSAGPTLGGLITEFLTWRWIFFVNVPIGLLALIVTFRVLPASRRRRQQFDPLGAAFLAVGLAAITLGLSFAPEWGLTSPMLIACVLLGLLGVIATIVVEKRVEQPVLDLALFQDRVFSSAVASLVLSFLALFAVSFLLPFYFENLRGFSPERSGLLLTPLSLMIALIAPVSGSLADRVESRWLAAGGLTLAAAGLLLLAQLDSSSSYPDIIWRLALAGLGVGLFQSPNNRTLMAAAPRAQTGEASGVLSTGRVVGQSLSVALAGTIFASFGGAAASAQLQQAHSQGQSPSPEQLAALTGPFLGGFHAAFLVCGLLAALGIAAALVRGSADPD